MPYISTIKLINPMENTTVKEVHISQVTVGDTIEHDGQLMTVTASNIGGDSFIGKTLFGDSYRSGSKKVKLVTFKKTK